MDHRERKRRKMLEKLERAKIAASLNVRKGIHISLRADTHMAFRIILKDRGLFMQEVLDGFAQRIVKGDPRAMSIIDELVDSKRQVEHDGVVDALTRHSLGNSDLNDVDTDVLFDAIEGSGVLAASNDGEEAADG